MTRFASKRGLGIVEFVLAVVVLGVMLVPFYSMFVRTRETTFKSAMAYKAMHVAREELQEIRTLPLFGMPARPASGGRPAIPAVQPYNGHPWRPVAGQPVFVLSSTEARQGQGGLLSQLAYPPSYNGIETLVEVGAQAGPDIRVVQLMVRWQEKGEVVGQGGRQSSPAMQTFHTLVTRRGGGQ